ncbi:ATP-dependent Clp protease proteolytic subunit [Paenibacillus sp. TAB 01]|uniref:ATP-dependent Clp protease proteolytic subunit n=1 Tax=Paenibacillus sp. TAB 01 TaxID=3368988 RepID=UPI003753AFE3
MTVQKFWNLKQMTKNSAEITIYGDIGNSWWSDSISARQFSADLKALGDDLEQITVRMNSAGGSVFEGLAIRSILKNHKADITVRCGRIRRVDCFYYCDGWRQNRDGQGRDDDDS